MNMLYIFNSIFYNFIIKDGFDVQKLTDEIKKAIPSNNSI